LKGGKVKSCGCIYEDSEYRRKVAQKGGASRFHDMAGKRYGKLVVREKLSERSCKGEIMWLCKCDCGNEHIVRGSSLRCGNTKSCGCLPRGKRTLPVGEAAFRSVLTTYKFRAKKRRLSWKLTEEEFRKLTQMPCHYCGTLPSNKGGNAQRMKHLYIYNGIDRVDSNKGYASENCVPCCKICNKAKLALPLQEFLDWIDRVHTHMHATGKSVDS